MNKISVIVPVYNVKEYIKECINSIQSQTFDNLEIILVNDGSTDGSDLICELFAESDDRIRVIHQKNQGVSEARNNGLIASTGEYITFVDADDWIKECHIELLYNLICEKNASYAASSWERISSKKCIPCKIPEYKNGILLNGDIINSLMDDSGISGYVWNKLYKREIIFPFNNGIYFDKKLSILEDLEWNLRILSTLEDDKKVVACSMRTTYCYRVREGSALNSEKTDQEFEVLKARQRINKYIDQELHKGAFERNIHQLLILYRKLILLSGVNKQYQSLFEQYKKEYKNLFSRYKSFISKKDELKAYMAMEHPNITNFILGNRYGRRAKIKKLGIVTIVDYNYGNRLQNYALQQYLYRFSEIVETIPIKNISPEMRRIKLLCKIIWNSIIPVKTYKKEIGWDYFDQLIHWASSSEYKKLEKQYEYLIAGSDQIWNPYFNFNSEREFLTFAEKKKRITYAASIGVDHIPEDRVVQYKRYLEEMASTSVREETASHIIKELTGKDVPIVVDPTMLLTDKEWDKIAKKSKVKSKGNYVLKYFLGIQNTSYDSFIEEFARMKKLSVIDIRELDNRIRYKFGPSEFVSLIKNCQMVFTDSFHGTIFSILYQRPFLVFERSHEEGYGNMSSRLDTLLSTFGFQDRLVDSEEKLVVESSKIEECNFESVERLLQEQRAYSYTYLKNALKV